jgi:hypothetical protein
MVVLLAGASHTGKTALAQRLLKKYGYPYLSIDHLKMGLIRCGYTDLTPQQDDLLTDYLWPIVREMIKTAIENDQNLIVEGCYIPFDWKKDFEAAYLSQIRYCCLIMSRRYIETHFEQIRACACVAECRTDGTPLLMEQMVRANDENLRKCRRFGCEYIWIDQEYDVDWSL